MFTDKAESATATLTAAVRALYERHPYPKYPLLAKPRWQDGYLAHSGFAARLAADLLGRRPLDAGAILVGGAGEILPYIFRRWEKAQRPLVNVDLSGASLRRARFRLGWRPGHTSFVRGDLHQYLQDVGLGAFAHIDAYGVLHHMPNPRATLELMHTALKPGGTVRLMVYNREARAWAWHLQRFFALLNLSPHDRAAVKEARAFLVLLAECAPALKAKLRQLGTATFTSDARFADLFLHPREARLSSTFWFERIKAAGFTLLGLFDRYGELDDLPNPLWHAPNAAELSERCADFRFENNLELFLAKSAKATPPLTKPAWLGRYLLKAPPSLWFSYEETQDLSAGLRRKLWAAHLAYVLHGDARPSHELWSLLSRRATQRLARVGAILPGQVSDPGRRAAFACPLAESMEVPPCAAPVPLENTPLPAALQQMLAASGRERSFAAAFERLRRAQAEAARV